MIYDRNKRSYGDFRKIRRLWRPYWICKNANGRIFAHPLEYVSLTVTLFISLNKKSLYSISTLHNNSSWLESFVCKVHTDAYHNVNQTFSIDYHNVSVWLPQLSFFFMLITWILRDIGDISLLNAHVLHVMSFSFQEKCPLEIMKGVILQVNTCKLSIFCTISK